MDNAAFHHANSLVEEIREAETMRQMWAAGLPDAGAEVMVFQYRNMKRKLVKELLAVLFRANISFQHLESFIQSAGVWLKKNEAEEVVSPELEANLFEVERMLA